MHYFYRRQALFCKRYALDGARGIWNKNFYCEIRYLVVRLYIIWNI